ncbi:MAG TPA: protocatechuate 3,4-dioxygenase subunit alpha [Casimicrobiaceae bacterium]
MTTCPMPETPSEPFVITPSQTVGPFFSVCLAPRDRPGIGSARLATPDAVGKRITIEGRVLDGDDAPVPDALIEIWQADGEGRYAGFHRGSTASSFTGFGRATCDDQGRFAIETVKPGQVVDLDGRVNAPHIAIGIFGKGINRRLYTRLYFPDENGNDGDRVLSSVAPERRASMMAEKIDAAGQRYAFTIRLQGADETVFLDA